MAAYTVIYVTKTVERKFKTIVSLLEDNNRKELISFIYNTPNGNDSSHYTCKKIGNCWQYDIPGYEGNRLLYQINDKLKGVLVYSIGTHDEIKRYIRKYIKKIKKNIK